MRKGEWWWLRSPGHSSSFTAFVTYCGDTYKPGNYVFCDKITIRPCFSISLSNLNKGDKVFIENTLCTVIDKDLVLSDNLICFHIFDKNNNVWETSSLKQYLESKEFLDMIVKGAYI